MATITDLQFLQPLKISLYEKQIFINPSEIVLEYLYDSPPLQTKETKRAQIRIIKVSRSYMKMQLGESIMPSPSPPFFVVSSCRRINISLLRGSERSSHAPTSMQPYLLRLQSKLSPM